MTGTAHHAMHAHDLQPFAHSHTFADEGQRGREQALTAVTLLTLLTMAGELAVGWWSGSLALTADGWHMGTHALALGGAVLAYRWSQRAATQRAVQGGPAGFAFGGWKIEVLAAYTSGLLLLAVALWLAWEGVDTLRHPRPVAYGEALVVAVVGLAVNLASVWLLSRGAAPAAQGAAPAAQGADAHGPADGRAHEQGHGHADGHADGHAHGHEQQHGHGHGHEHGQEQGHGHGHGHEHEHEHEHRHEHGQEHEHGHPHPHAEHATPAPALAHAHAGHGHSAGHGHGHDHNFSAAYIHVLADAVTSVLAIAALAGGFWFALRWLDPAVALLGAAVIGQWAYSVLKGTASALVDATEDPALTQRVRELIEADGDAKVADLHVWQVGAQAWCAALSVVADVPLPAATYRSRLNAVALLRHVTVEVHRCPAASPV